MIRSRLAAAALLAGLGTAVSPAWSLDVPRPSPKDCRIRFVDYDPTDVIQLNTAIGVATHVVLPEEEEYVTYGFGDGAAYEFERGPRHLLLKPIADQADTNFLYVTAKRNYAFRLHFAKTPAKCHELYRLEIRAPADEIKAAQAEAEQARIARELAQPALAINWQSYSMSGDASLAPVSAWDDGAQTWLRFAPGQDLPAVYFVDADGQEVIANRHMADERTIVLHRIARRWHLRLGDQVLAIHNDAAQARDLATGTVSPAVERVIKEAK